MAGKLTKTEKQNGSPKMLTKKIGQDKFLICFSLKLDKKFNLSKLEKDNLKKLQKFLDKISNMSMNDVDEKYKRPSDNNDCYKIGGTSHNVSHYEVGESFRLHGILADGMFHVIRIDPNHKFHNK